MDHPVALVRDHRVVGREQRGVVLLPHREQQAEIAAPVALSRLPVGSRCGRSATSDGRAAPQLSAVYVRAIAFRVLRTVEQVLQSEA